MRTGDSWRPFGIGPDDFDDVPAGHDGIKIIHLGEPAEGTCGQIR